MLARIRKQLEEKDQGFTLVELLVVIIIIGILAAVAIPLYLNQQAKAKDSSLKSDLKNAQIEVANQLVDDPSGASVDLTGFATSPDVALTLQRLDVAAGTFCIDGTVAGGAIGAFAIDESGSVASGAC